MQNLHASVGTHGQQLKTMADDIMQQTWDNDIQSKQCYIYDYYHDDQFDEGLYGYDPSLSKTKIPVKLKFIVKAYKSAAKDDPEYHIQFEPDAWNSMSCKPQWFVDGYQKLGVEFPVGLLCDIPDDKGVYQKWLIFYKEEANQFVKCGVMKCNYLFMWIKDDGIHRYKRKMWGVDRSQSSYTSGKWSGDKLTVLDNQDKFWLPWNPISAEIKHDQRLFISMLQDEPYVYMISKINNTSPKGVIECTVVQASFNKNSDFVDNDPKSPTYGEMYADYYSSAIIPEEQVIPNTEENLPDIEVNTDILSIEAKTYSIRINGGSKVVYAKILDKDGNDVTNNYDSSLLEWSFSLKDDEFVEDGLIVIDEAYSFKDGNQYKCKFKFKGDEVYLNERITVTLKVNELSASADLDIVS
jgi:hypothetical protein